MVSRHLGLLRGACLVTGERQSMQIFSAIAAAHLRQILDGMATHISEAPPEA